MMEETKKAEWGEGKTNRKGEWKVGLGGREWLQEKSKGSLGSILPVSVCAAQCFC